MHKHRTRAEIEAGIGPVLQSPAEGAAVEALFSRPAPGKRLDLPALEVSVSGGIAGDHWSLGCWKTLPDGSPDPDVQVSLMNRRMLHLIAGARDNWARAGNNIIVDMDLSIDNLPIGQRLRVGTAELEIGPVANTGCDFFIERYGRDACVFVNTGIAKQKRLRGVYARVVKDGQIRIGDIIRKA
jgi:hypothetical protein